MENLIFVTYKINDTFILKIPCDVNTLMFMIENNILSINEDGTCKLNITPDEYDI